MNKFCPELTSTILKFYLQSLVYDGWATSAVWKMLEQQRWFCLVNSNMVCALLGDQNWDSKITVNSYWKELICLIGMLLQRIAHYGDQKLKLSVKVWMFYEWKDIKGRKKEEKDRIPIFIFFLFLFSQMNLLSYILCYFMLAYRVKAIITTGRIAKTTNDETWVPANSYNTVT